MAICMEIHNVKNIDDFKFMIPTEKGLYALTGENSSGKSTIIACAAAAFYVPSFHDYFGTPRSGASIRFVFDDKCRNIESKDGKWLMPNSFIGISGFYEGSIVYGNRFKDIDYSLIKKLSKVRREQLQGAHDFIKKNLGFILHDDEKYYDSLFVLNQEYAQKMNLQRVAYFYENKNTLISQLNMSTGENLLLTILTSIERRIKKVVYGTIPSYILLDEVEMALHPSALRRLVCFLENISLQNNIVVLFSTHSVELIKHISPFRIYYLQKYPDGELGIINPCYPVYATRNLESSSNGYDSIVVVEDILAKSVVDRILRDKKLLANKRVLVLPVGGWMQVLTFTNYAIRTNLADSTTKFLVVLDRDIQYEVPKFLAKEHIGFAEQPAFLPVQSLEKYLYSDLLLRVDKDLFRELDNYVFQLKSLHVIVNEYSKEERCCSGANQTDKSKALYSKLQSEMKRINKTDEDLVEIIVEYLFKRKQTEIEELTRFFEKHFAE